jgi:DtxR family Mn-dependent transcriptional regulator
MILNERRLSPLQMRYMVEILLLSKHGAVRSVDIAQVLSVKESSVACMLKDLQVAGLVVKKPYGDVFLTEEGKGLAEHLLSRQERIREVLSSSLGFGEKGIREISFMILGLGSDKEALPPMTGNHRNQVSPCDENT